MIPVFEPQIGQEEITAVANAVRDGEISGTFGKNLPEFEKEFAKYIGCKEAVAVSSGTTALHLAVRALGLTSGDEVLVSASTNIASALCVYNEGGIVVPVDCEKRTWNLDLNLLESLITPKTKAILPVHLFGHPVDMDKLNVIAKKHQLKVIEDCAESHGATVRGKMTGTFGTLGCFSFYANKIMTTGEGGMVTTNDLEIAEKMRMLRNLAFTTPRFKHDVPGFNYRMTGMQAALGRVQLKRVEEFISGKRKLAKLYQTHFSEIPFLQHPAEESWARNVYWMYAVVLDESSPISRDSLMKELLREGIETRTFFCPMNQQPFLLKQKGFRKTPCPVADRIWEQGLYLPSSPSLTENEVKLIVLAFKKIIGNSQRLAA